MTAFQERVIAEKSELDVKTSALGKFLGGDIFKTLPEDEQKRLGCQHSLMEKYSGVLGERITNFA